MDRELNAAERTLFDHISYDIREHPDGYRSSGKRLDRYYDDEQLCWQRRKLELGRKINRIESAPPIDDVDKFILRDLKEGLASPAPPPLWIRLKYALEDAWLDYQGGRVLAEEDARVILIIAWVTTDPEANSTNLDITKFADLPWKLESLGIPSRMGLVRDLFLDPEPILSRTHFFEFSEEAFLRLVFVAWHTLFGGTLTGAEITKEMRRALVGEKRLLGLSEQENSKKEIGLIQGQWTEKVDELITGQRSDIGERKTTKPRGRPKKYTTEQRAKMRDMYRRIYLETNDSKGAYNKVADYFGIVSGDAVKAAIRNLKS
jgi:hypothetical protein